jgi:F0F1-type ATP synthase assembly protein I
LGLKINKKPTDRLFIAQISVVLIIAIASWPIFGVYVAVSVGCGGFVAIVANWVFSRILFRSCGATQARQIVMSLFLGELSKLVVTMGLFTLALLVFSPLGVLIGFIVVQVSHYLALWLVE